MDQDLADNSYLCVCVTVINCLQIPSEFNFLELLNSLQMWKFTYLFLKDWQVGLRMRKCKSYDFNQRFSAKLPKNLTVLVYCVFLLFWTRFVLFSVGTWELFCSNWFCVFSANRVMNGLPSNLPYEIPNMTSLEKKNAS